MLDIKQVVEKEKTSPREEHKNQPVSLITKELESILTMQTDPWKPECVVKILKEVTLGWDISGTECSAVQAIVTKFTDCFALTIKQVNAIPGTVHKLNIPEGTTFRMKIPPRSYNPDQ